jgi:hypothetical protein
MNNGFKYFPKKLYTKPVKMIAALSSAVKSFGMSRPSEIFYSVKDGNWNDVSVWETVSGRVGKLPTINDDVYIKHRVTINTNISVNNVYVSGYLTKQFNYVSISIFGNLQVTGTFDILGNEADIFLYGEKNYIDNFIQAPVSTNRIFFTRNGDQNVMPLNYVGSMGIGGLGTKTLTANTEVGFNFSVGNQVTLEIGSYDFTVNGTTSIGVGARVSKLGEGNILFKGIYSTSLSSFLSLTGNPNIEFRGGFNAPNGCTVTSGTGTWKFTTNNQTVLIAVPTTFNGPIIVEGPITVINNTSTAEFIINNSLNGTEAGSTFQNRGVIHFSTQASVENSMTTGTFDRTSFANTVGYTGNYSATLPYSTYWNLLISGTGTKTTSGNVTTTGAVTCTSSGSLTLGGNLIIGGNLSVGSSGLVGTLQCSTFDLTVTGTTTIWLGGSAFRKSGAGNILFIGNVTGTDGNGSVFDLSGNPNVELRAGFVTQFYGTGGSFNSGTGTWTFTTNNQTLDCRYVSYSFNCTIIISNVIVTITRSAGSGILNLLGTIDGTTAGSTLNLNGSLYLNNATTPLPMHTTGIFNPTNATTSVLGFVFNGNYTLPYTSFNGLLIAGTGTKTLSGNTTLSSLLSLQGGNATLELASFDFNNSGVTSISAGALLLSKTGAGTITFGGLVTIISANNFGGFNFTGNPTIEFRNGFTNGAAAISSFNLGSGPISFTTNNQTFTHPFRTTTINGTMTIGNGITLTLDNSNSGGTTFIINGVVNGSNGTSALRMGVNNVTVYNNTTQPMATGVLDTSTNLNTWIYGLNNQDIKGSPTISPKQVYRNLTLNGTGVKTLQGHVSVLNTYTLTAPATLALNGFTLTNP